MERSMVSVPTSVGGRMSRAQTGNRPRRGFQVDRTIQHRATRRWEEAPGPEERLQSPLSIMDAFMTNPVAFLAGAFVGLMELDVLSDDSAIAKVLRQDDER